MSRLYEKLFLGGRYFTIAIRRRIHDDIKSATSTFSAEYVVPANFSKWCADPILADNNGHTYLFYESYVDGKGRIEVSEIMDNCQPSEPYIVLESDSHYSYPFVFQIEDEWYMIPESSELGKVDLYRSIDFPYKWSLETTLLYGSYVDTTFFEYNGNKFLVTFAPDGRTENVIPKAFRIKNNNNYELEELKWNSYDGLKVRGAGPVIESNGFLYRPFQISDERLYGNAVGFSKLKIRDNQYFEEEMWELTPDHVHLRENRIYFDGLHTYSYSSRFEAIDIRCRDRDYLKLFKKIVSKIRKKAG